MSADLNQNILRRIRGLFAPPADAAATDADLLRRFAQGRDQAAFELLVWRHAGLVLHVCRQLLRDEQAVEDAFQATFLVLVRKAGSILRSEALPGWLYRVAFRVALRARSHRVVQTGVDLAGVPAPASAAFEEDTRLVLHEEVARLPAKYRLPVVYCYLEGKTHEDAARELGWPKGTVASRLARARDLLHARLARRGVTIAALGLAAHLCAPVVNAGMAGRVTALLAALRSVGSHALSPSAVLLAEGVLNAMFWKKIQWAAVIILLFGGVGATGGLWAVRPGVAQESAARPPVALAGPEASKDDTPAAPIAVKPAQPDDPVKEATDRAVARHSLKVLGLAMHNHLDAVGTLPPAALTDKAGKPLLSWRVALLPYLDEAGLYKQFKLDEPWDSPHNKRLLAKMPRVYAPVGVKLPQPDRTFYQVFVGPGTLYPNYHRPWHPPGPGYSGSTFMPGTSAGPMGTSGMPPMMGGTASGPGGYYSGMMGSMASGASGYGPPITQISDGTSNTFLIAEGSSAVPWTKPDDISYDPKKPLPPLGGQFANVFHIAFADGAVRALPKDLPEATIRAAITPAGGEEVRFDVVPRGSESPVRQKFLDELRSKNAQLKEEVTILNEILGEIKTEVANLRWAVARDRMLRDDPTAAALQRENEALEKSLEANRDQARKLMEEVRRIKEEMKKKAEK